MRQIARNRRIILSWWMRLSLGIALAACCGACFDRPASACNIPVYRYAMSHWQPAPYHVYYASRGPAAKEDAEVNRLLDEASRAEPGVNLIFESIDVARREQVDRLPEAVQKALQTHIKEPLPLHLLFAPWDSEVWAGRLKPADARAMLDSPVRKRVAQLLHEGHATVLLFLPGKNPAENKKAEAVLQEAIARAAKGQFSQASTPPDQDEAAPKKPNSKDPESKQAKPPANGPGADPIDSEPNRARPSRVLLKSITLSRSDPAETWLVRMLSAMEQVPAEQAAQPMFFAVYGRGRALGPCIGKLIDADNLEQLVSFLTGDCSCQIKDQNPGMDLLIGWDWDATAAALAAADDARSAEQDGPRDNPADGPAAAKPAEAARGQTTPGARPVSTGPQSPAAVETTTAASTCVASTPAPKDLSGEPGSAEEEEEAEPGGSSFASRQMWKFGAGFALAVVAIFLVGTILLRRNRPDDSP